LLSLSLEQALIAVIAKPQIKMAAKPAIKRVHNKLVCFVEREQARPQVNIVN
jgi:hypothetical protein